MRFGFMYRRSPDHPDPMVFARRLEDLGFDSFWASETPNNRGPSMDTFAVLCYAAAATRSISLGSNVILLPLHHPAWVAKQWGTLDILSNGRTILGVGVAGEYPKQFEVFGIPKEQRGIRTDEGIQVIKNLWTEDLSSYHGEVFRFEGITMEPKPTSSPHPPIWVGGRPGGLEFDEEGQPRLKSRTAAMKRAALLGDAWCPYYMTIDMYRASVLQVKQYADNVGRDISQMVWGYNVHMWMRDSYDAALEEAAKRLRYGRNLSSRIEGYDLLGASKDIIRKIEGLADAGLNYLVLHNEAIEGQEDRTLQRFSEEVIPHFR